jgi:hypothetical protein
MTMSNVAPAKPTVRAAAATRTSDGQERHGGHDERADEPQPAAALAEAPEERQPHVVDQRRPQELEVVGEERQREGGHRALADALLRQARSERRADHREGEAGGDAEEQRRERRGLEIRADAFRQPVAPGPSRRGCHSRS